MAGCTKDPSPTPAARPAIPEPKTHYEKALVATRSHFQFQHWPMRAQPAVVTVFETLLVELRAAGESAPERQKIDCFKRAVAALNELNRRDPTVIETSEAEQLVDIGNHIAMAAGLEPRKYGDGEGPLSAGRDW